MERKGNGSILSFHICYFIHTLTHVSLQCPQRPGISAHWTHKINTKKNLLKFSSFVYTEKTTVTHGVVQLRQLLRVGVGVVSSVSTDIRALMT